MNVFAEITDRQQVVNFNAHPLTKISEVLSDYCAMKGIVGSQREIVIEAGRMAYTVDRKTEGAAIVIGQRVANRLVDIMRDLRTRYGARDLPPEPDHAA